MILENVRELCKGRGITISALEKATGIGNGTIARWGERNPRLDSLQTVADYFGVTVNDLLTNAEPVPVGASTG